MPKESSNSCVLALPVWHEGVELVELVSWCVLEDGEQPQLLSGVEALVVETQQSVNHTVLERPWSEAELTLLEDLAIAFISCEDDDASCVLYVPPGVDHEAFSSRLYVVERHVNDGESRGAEPVLYPVVSLSLQCTRCQCQS